MADGGRMGDAAGQPVDVLLSVYHGDDGLAADFLELGRRDAFLQESVDDFGDCLLHDGSGGPGFTRPTTPSEAQIADTETRSVNAVDEFTLFAELAPEQGTITGAKHTKEKVRRETAFIEVTRNAPAGDALGRINLANEIGASDAALRRLLVSGDIDQRTTGETAEPAFGGGEDFFRRHATAQGEHDVRRHVATGVIGAQVFRGDPYEKIAMTDDRLAQGV